MCNGWAVIKALAVLPSDGSKKNSLRISDYRSDTVSDYSSMPLIVVCSGHYGYASNECEMTCGDRVVTKAALGTSDAGRPPSARRPTEVSGHAERGARTAYSRPRDSSDRTEKGLIVLREHEPSGQRPRFIVDSRRRPASVRDFLLDPLVAEQQAEPFGDGPGPDIAAQRREVAVAE